MNIFQKILEVFRGKKKEKERIYILDTCALKTRKSMQIIKEASKIILLTGTIRELDKYKKEKNLYGNNICNISRKSREDEKSEKYICVAGYEKYSYQDDNIIAYCRKHKKVIILTSDNNLCNMAKAYNISYLFLENEKEVSEKKEIEEQKSTPQEQKANKMKLQNFKGFIFKGKKIYLAKNIENLTYFVIRKEEVLQNTSEVELHIEDIIYKVVLNKGGIVDIYKYEIISIKNSYLIEHHRFLVGNIKHIHRLKEMKYPTEIQNEVISILKKETKPNGESSIEVKKQEKAEICLFKNYIPAISKEECHIQLEREELAPIESYTKGYIICQFKYNIKIYIFVIYVYNNILNNDKYREKQVNRYLIYCFVWIIFQKF